MFPVLTDNFTDTTRCPPVLIGSPLFPLPCLAPFPRQTRGCSFTRPRRRGRGINLVLLQVLIWWLSESLHLSTVLRPPTPYASSLSHLHLPCPSTNNYAPIPPNPHPQFLIPQTINPHHLPPIVSSYPPDLPPPLPLCQRIHPAFPLFLPPSSLPPQKRPVLNLPQCLFLDASRHKLTVRENPLTPLSPTHYSLHSFIPIHSTPPSPHNSIYFLSSHSLHSTLPHSLHSTQTHSTQFNPFNSIYSTLLTHTTFPIHSPSDSVTPFSLLLHTHSSRHSIPPTTYTQHTPFFPLPPQSAACMVSLIPGT